ncbi:hypothetical protein ABH930_002168 [Kitasatospora sp. GAS204A]|uniref:NACHT domain-containing protein n=1 Tax=unclassified Kitasatospora TaxID=2633591 RepID=UPI002475B683|nr:hypothetical protein [Kitasatospora sp. GAS204B]MDH6115969.1 hypothetical protein [Kitasatospora sp. GAS204B]
MAQNVHNEFHGRAEFVVQAGSITGPITYVAAPLTEEEQAARRFARMVHLQWSREAGLRGLLDPAPLSTRWVDAHHEYGDHVRLAGQVEQAQAGDLAAFAAAFLALPKQRLVLLGEAGSGKSSVAVLLTLRLLADRTADDPVPVLLSLGSWDPLREHFQAWLAARLAEDYPKAQRQLLLDAQLITPVLDGLDEMSPPRRAAALDRLHKGAAGTAPLILTCRAADYTGGVLRSAAVVRAQPVMPQDALAYLEAVVPPQRHGPWQPVFAVLAGELSGPLLTVSANPLMLGLIRAVHGAGHPDPAHLLSFTEVRELENHLLDGLLPSVFTDVPAAPAQPAARRRRWALDRAERWLGFLATDLTVRHSDDLSWWQLHQRVSSWRRALLTGAATWLLAIPLLAADLLAIGQPYQVLPWSALLFGGGVLGFSVGGCAGAAGARGSAIRPAVIRTTERPGPAVLGALLRRPWAALLLCCWLLWAAANGISFVRWTQHRSGPVPNLFPLASFAALVGTVAIQWLFNLLTAPIRREELADPASALARGRRSAVRPALGVGLLSAVGCALFFVVVGAGMSLTWSDAWVGMSVLAIEAGVLGAAIGLVRTSWFAYRHAHLHHALSGRLPWRLSKFLADAHRLGVLRQVGPVYQFRHARLRERLAERRAR